MIEITLTWPELRMAASIGELRHAQSLKMDRKDRHGYSGDGWGIHIEGAAGELALAKVLGVYWDGSVDTFKGSGDVAGLQVRTRSNHSWDLLVRPDDASAEAYVLVTGRSPQFRVHGWKLGADCKHPEWLQSHGGRPPAYFVPQRALEGLESLPLVRSKYTLAAKSR